MNDGKQLITETPYECWNICKMTANCIAIAWGHCDSSWAIGRKTCWLKDSLYPRETNSIWTIIRYKGTKNNILKRRAILLKNYTSIAQYSVPLFG